MSNLVELSGTFCLDQESTAFKVEIRMPVEDAQGDVCCTVLSEELFTRKMDVYGATRNQAIRLAITLVKEAITGRLQTTEPGSQIE